MYKRKASTAINRPYKRPRLATPAVKRKQNTSLTQELKYNDVTFNTDATTTGTMVALTTFASGDTALLRDGNKILVRSFELRVKCELESITANATLRFCLVRDKNSNMAQAPLATATGFLDTITPESLRTVGFMSRYDVLMDKTFALNQSASNAAGFQKLFFKKYIKVPQSDALVSFGDGTASIPVSNSYTLLYFSDLASGVADVNILGTCRMRFVG